MNKLLLSQAIWSNEIPTGNLLWVDGVNGNDSLAVRGRLTVQFKTLAAAKNAAVAGDTIIVMPGTYVISDNLAKNNVHWHFIQGAKMQGGAFKLDSAITTRISGELELLASPGPAVEVTHASAGLHLKCRRLYGTYAGVKVTAGSAYVEADSIESDEQPGVDVSGGTLHLRARSVYSDQTHGVSITGGTLNLEAYSVSSNSGKGLYFTGGTAVVTAVEIYSNTAEGVEYNSAYSNALTLRHARVASKATPTSGNFKAGLLIVNGTGNLRLMNCCFIMANNGAASAYSIHTTGGGATVLLSGYNTGNANKHPSVTLTPNIFSYDANL